VGVRQPGRRAAASETAAGAAHQDADGPLPTEHIDALVVDVVLAGELGY
jgi:hypothetical protein